MAKLHRDSYQRSHMPIILSPVGSYVLSWQLVQFYVEDGLHSWVHHSLKINVQK